MADAEALPLDLIVHGNKFQGGGWICPGIPNLMGFTDDMITPDWCRLEETRWRVFLQVPVTSCVSLTPPELRLLKNNAQ